MSCKAPASPLKFKRTWIASILLLSAYALGIYFFSIQSRLEDAPSYRKLIAESVDLRSKHALEREPAIQIRSGVQKDIWTLDGTERPHVRILSQNSELTIRQNRGKFSAEETLHSIDSWMQEEIDRSQNIQQIRHCLADEGLYSFPAHEFLAKNVHLDFYRIPGHELPTAPPEQRPYLKGIAREVAFRTSNKAPTFTAYHLLAEFDPIRGLP